MPVISNSDGSFTIAGVDQRNSGDSALVIQAAVDDLYAKYGGGMLWLPRPGTFRLNSGITLKGGVTLRGHGKENTILFAQHADFDVLTCDSTGRYCGARDLFVAGYMGASPTKNSVVVADNVPAIFLRCNIWGGLNALKISGVDGTIEDCFIGANGGSCILSTGANWYRRCKVDTIGVAATNAFSQGVGALAGVMENHFDQCDFSGSYTRSVLINDGGGSTAITVFNGGVFSSPITITAHQYTSFIGCEFGSTSFSTPSNTSIVGSYKLGAALSVANASKAGNVNIS